MGLTLSQGDAVFNDDFPIGAVISQSVPEGTEVPRGTDVSVVVSNGPDIVVFPDSHGRSHVRAGGGDPRARRFPPGAHVRRRTGCDPERRHRRSTAADRQHVPARHASVDRLTAICRRRQYPAAAHGRTRRARRSRHRGGARARPRACTPARLRRVSPSSSTTEVSPTTAPAAIRRRSPRSQPRSGARWQRRRQRPRHRHLGRCPRRRRRSPSSRSVSSTSSSTTPASCATPRS